MASARGGSRVSSSSRGEAFSRRLRGRLAYLLFRLCSALARRIPPPVAYPILDLAGDLAYLANRRGRAAVEANLLHVLGRRSRRWRAAVRGVFRHGARNYYDTFRIPTLTREAILDLVAVDGWEHLEAALAGGRGAILVGAHLSSVGLAGQVVAARGYTIHVAVEPIEPPELMRFLTRLRAGVGIQLVPLGPRLGAHMLSALARNEVVGLIVDRDVAGSGLPIQFFGCPARLPTGPAVLALRTGAPILPAIAIRRSDGTFRGVIEPPIPVRRSGTMREDVAAITRSIAARLEYYIRGNPEQWTVFQHVWPDAPCRLRCSSSASEPLEGRASPPAARE